MYAPASLVLTEMYMERKKIFQLYLKHNVDDVLIM